MHAELIDITITCKIFPINFQPAFAKSALWPCCIDFALEHFLPDSISTFVYLLKIVGDGNLSSCIEGVLKSSLADLLPKI